MKKFKTILALTFITLSALLSACSKDDSSSSSSGYRYDTYGNCVNNSGSQVNYSYCQNSNGQYYSQNGYCYNRSGQQVNYTYCQNQNVNGGYYYQNGMCYNQNGQQVNYTYCQNQTNTGVNGAYQSCYGYFIYNNQYVYCYGANCAGYTLISAMNGQAVRCQ